MLAAQEKSAGRNDRGHGEHDQKRSSSQRPLKLSQFGKSWNAPRPKRPALSSIPRCRSPVSPNEHCHRRFRGAIIGSTMSTGPEFTFEVADDDHARLRVSRGASELGVLRRPGTRESDPSIDFGLRRAPRFNILQPYDPEAARLVTLNPVPAPTTLSWQPTTENESLFVDWAAERGVRRGLGLAALLPTVYLVARHSGKFEDGVLLCTPRPSGTRSRSRCPRCLPPRSSSRRCPSFHPPCSRRFRRLQRCRRWRSNRTSPRRHAPLPPVPLATGAARSAAARIAVRAREASVSRAEGALPAMVRSARGTLLGPELRLHNPGTADRCRTLLHSPVGGVGFGDKDAIRPCRIHSRHRLPTKRWDKRSACPHRPQGH